MTTSGSLSNERLGDIVDHNGVSCSFDHSPDEHAEAIEHLDFAINEFREMKMAPALERALGRTQVPGA